MDHLDAKGVMSRYGLTEGRLAAAVRLGRFPSPVKLGALRVWLSAHLDAYDSEQIGKAEAERAAKLAAAPAILAARKAASDKRRAKVKAGKVAAQAEDDEDPLALPEPQAAQRPRAIPASLPAHLGGPGLLDQMRGAR